MSAVGIIVSTVRIDMGLGQNGDRFWAFMSLPIFSIWIFGVAFLRAMTPSGEVPKQGLGWLGRTLRPLY